ncbi:MAG TPA: nicotinate-nicotinamide nucleotide adenylyltransferase, partial [Oceanipulchritudo sp.]|nr:nicotinate-nicotinamide nucleotide adenylyltransferase [Oceanipulchritudo sp.]
FGIWEGELDREGPSYTLESIQHIERVYPNSHLFWIIGWDQMPGLTNWYGIEHLVSKVGFVLVRRPGYEMAWPDIPGLMVYPIDNAMIPVSGTEIRSRIRQDLPLEGLVPQSIEDYIREKGLYK